MDTTIERSLIPITILAAGASSRMGSHKLLLELAGRPLIGWSVLAACQSRASDVLVVSGRDFAAVEAALPKGRQRVIVNHRYFEGQSGSLELATALTPPTAPGVIILLADQPFMDSDSIDRVISAASAEPDRITVGSVDGKTGHPVYLPRRVFDDIMTQVGDRGARDILARERDRLQRIALTNAYAHLDVDTPEDYARATELAYLLTSTG